MKKIMLLIAISLISTMSFAADDVASGVKTGSGKAARATEAVLYKAGRVGKALTVSGFKGILHLGKDALSVGKAVVNDSKK